ncbi:MULTISPECIES: acetoacetate decarboxylase family protein [Microbulbifer]|uniref:acetoacetate decarboxylase family protein n=1 Tax=Microbulbifer TaxID=48073 RepID=UPI001CD22CF1|nr:acetoacetate decarboxylase family protein [Microbulbifer agarilyticus]MCA0900058.1 acetoacetate decarboxylase family protein [Microbulbifer agarilyticus]
MRDLPVNQPFAMPAHFGPRGSDARASGWYRDVTMMVVSYVTDGEKLARYLPEPFSLDDEPVITVVYACNKQVDWLAGHGYNLIGVHANARFDGRHDQLRGTYTLAMWENLTDPILTGRELQGIPKIYADIPEHTVNNGCWHAEARHFDNSIVNLQVDDLRPPTAEEIAESTAAQQGRDNPMAWRYMPAIGGFGSSVSEATTFPSETHYHDVQVGSGSVAWQQLSWEQNPTQFHIVNAIQALPVIEYRPAMVARCSVNLLVPDRLPRAIR